MQPQPTRTFFGHPIGLATLFTTELWERFSYYGMRALLVLYLVAPPDGISPPGGGLGMSNADAVAVFGSYSALVYLTPLAGGWIGDRIIGARKAVLIGGIVITAGHFMMALVVEAAFWAGLLLIAMGTGLLKPCISSMVGDLYAGQPMARRDAGFSIFYMGINLGALFAPLVTGWLAASYGWHWGFIAAGIGMGIAVIVYAAGWRSLGSAGLAPGNPATTAQRWRVLGLGLVGLGAFAGLVYVIGLFAGHSVATVSTALTIAVVAIAGVYLTRLLKTPGLTTTDKSRLRAFIWLFLGAVLFWMIYDQAGSTLSVFADQWTDRSIFGWQMPAAWLQSVNPVFIIIFAPIFAWMWTALANRAPTTPMRFGIALIGIGISFVVLVIPGLAADQGQMSSVWWLIGVYLLQTWAELLLSPTGLSASTALAPPGMSAQILALWFLAVSVGDAIGGQVARVFMGWGFAPYFGVFGLVAMIAGLIFIMAIRPRVEREMASTVD